MNIYMGGKEHIKNTPIRGQIMVNGQKIKIGQKTENDQVGVKDNSKSKVVQSAGIQQKKDPDILKQEAMKKALEQFLIGGEDTEERYQALLDKVKNGEHLTRQDLEYLKKRNPELYKEVKEEIMVEKQLEEKLKHCKTKEQAKDIYIVTMHKAQKLCGIRNNSNTKPNLERYNRLMKRIDKVWEKYKKGELGKKEDEDEIDKKEQKSMLRQKLEVFEQFQIIEEEELFSEES